MRCVLPHIPNPFQFIESIRGKESPAFLWVEFPNLDYIIQNELWYALSHDHVNYFTTENFKSRYQLLFGTTTTDGTWNIVLFQNLTTQKTEQQRFNQTRKLNDLENLLIKGETSKDTLSKNNQELIIWGGGEGSGFSQHTKVRRIRSFCN
jgi:hypothetical protein